MTEPAASPTCSLAMRQDEGLRIAGDLAGLTGRCPFGAGFQRDCPHFNFVHSYARGRKAVRAARDRLTDRRAKLGRAAVELAGSLR